MLFYNAPPVKAIMRQIIIIKLFYVVEDIKGVGRGSLLIIMGPLRVYLCRAWFFGTVPLQIYHVGRGSFRTFPLYKYPP
jgi:hypothetical protein